MTGWGTGHKSCVNGHRKWSALAYTLVITFRKEVVCAVPLDTKKETHLITNSGELIFYILYIFYFMLVKPAHVLKC